MNKGFTLIELSIVLIIVGLLVGGILVGQSLIESVRINRFVSDLQQYEIATVQFYKKFKHYPGDSPYFSPQGSGNKALRLGGTILDPSGDGGSNCDGVISLYEPIQAWTHLSQSQMLKKTFRAYSPTFCSGADSTIIPKEVAPRTITGDTYYADIDIVKFNASDNFAFHFILSSINSGAIENKLSSHNIDYTQTREVGLTRFYGNYVPPHVWGGPRPRVVQTIDSTTPYGVFYYFLAP